MAATKQVMMGGQILNGTDRFGLWVTEKIEGWFEPPTTRDGDVERSGSNGDYDLPSQFAARTPTLEGVLIAENRSDALLGLASLSNSAPLGVARLHVIDEGMRTWAMAKFAGLESTWLTRQSFRWQLRVKCPDPRRFGDVRVVPAGAGSATAVQNRGNFPASPVIVVPGPLTAGGYTVTGPNGELFTVTTSPASGTTHLIDMHDGLLRINGSMAAGSGFVSRADVFTIPAGGKANVTLSKGGRVELYDTYM